MMYRVPFWFFGVSIGCMGTVVGYVAMSGGVPMPQETHGGAIHTVPAWLWAVVFAFHGFGIAVGSILNRASIAAVSAAVGFLSNMYIGFFAASSDFGFLVSLGAFAFASMHGGVFVSSAKCATVSVIQGIINGKR